jgi:hypothetical protein
MRERESVPGPIGPLQPNLARVYDYLLGGKDNFAADRAVGDRIIATVPAVQMGVLAQRAVLGRVVRYLVGEAGIKQLIDIGAGLPTAENVHEIAQRYARGTRVVYVDNDPVVLVHARALLAGTPATIAVNADLRHPAGIIWHPEVRKHLDWRQPIGVLLCGILHYIVDSENPGALVKSLCDALPSGSYVFIHHLISSDDRAAADLQAAMKDGLGRTEFRSHDQVLGLFDNLELVQPGLVLVSEWRPDRHLPSASDFPVLRLACAGLGRKP